MAKIIQFQQFWERYQIPVQHPNPPPSRRKKSIIISAMPDEPFPLGHQDFRPILQRDGLILLSWALWENWGEEETLDQRYIVTWITTGERTHRHLATGPISKEELSTANPERRGDYFFYQGGYGSRADISSCYEKDIADYVYLAAPYDLGRETIPGFIRVLKALGSTVDFTLPLSLGRIKQAKAQAQEYLEKFASTEPDRSIRRSEA
ncbi:hypothetical protein AGMMS50268_18100 [Spirochaetia bacterium]|nr:hypothetical protein AGMMS50268_18100 [Spirochaetia bacterium]